jgi:FkbM family methyltransferase
MNDLITRALRARKVFIGRDYYQFWQVKRPLVNYGNRFADWTFCPDKLDEHSVIYSFSEPAEANLHSLKISDPEEGGEAGLKIHKLPVHRLATVLEKLGHDRIDILKMDIEGAEYEVIEDILNSPLPISQILIEFHHRFTDIGIGKTRSAVSRLNEAGYRIFNVSASGEEISFIQVPS